MTRARFRCAVAVAVLGGIVFLVASASPDDALFAAAVALVGLALVIALSDPVMHRDPLVAAGMVLAIGCAAADAVLTASGRDGAITVLATAGLVAGVAIAVLARVGRR